MPYFVPSLPAAPSFSGDTLVLPAAGSGNAAQLALDLLVSTLKMQRVGILDDEHVISVAGYDAFAGAPQSRRLALSLEVFRDAGRKLTVLMQRAPVVKGRCAAFAKNVFDWATSAGFAHVVELVCLDAGRRIDSQLFGRQVRYLVNEHASEAAKQKLWALAIPPLERLAPEGERDASGEPGMKKVARDHLERGEPCEYMRDGALSRALYDAASEAKLSLSVLLVFTQGDSITESQIFLEIIDSLLQISPAQEEGRAKWQAPESWKFMWGGPVEQSLYC
eukprot:tig00021127_g18698.t1